MFPQKHSGEHIVAGLFVRPFVRHSVRKTRIRVRPITSLFEVGFYNYFTEMITTLRQHVARKLGSIP